MKRHDLGVIRKLQAEKSLAHFIRQAWHVIEPNATLVWGKHLDAMCEHLQAVTDGRIKNLIINIPPGSTKSITCSVCWPAWTWINSPSTSWLTSSNDSDLVLRDAVSCRELIRSDWYQERWGNRFRLSFDQNVKNWYKNNRKGFRTAVSVGARVTGKKGGILLCDDPDDSVKVRSEVERRNVHEWWDKAFFNRVNNHRTGRRVLIGQRTDEDDLFGHIMKTANFVVLTLPEEFEPSRKCVTPIGWEDWRTEPGELLRPEMFGHEQVDEAKKRLRANYQAQHNQNPVNEHGNVFKREWLKYYRRSDSGQFWMFGDKAYEPSEITGRFLTVDTATTVKQTQKQDPDYTVISAWGRTRCGMLVWLDCFRYRCESPDIPPKVAEMYQRWGATKVIIEGGGTQKSAYQYCKRHDSHMNCVEYVPVRDKLANSIPAQDVAEAGRLWLPLNIGAFPLGDVEDELLRFTGDEKKDLHDDIVDTLSMAARAVHVKDAQPKRVAVSGTLRAGVG